MGCDIHVFSERRVGGKWVTADKWTENKYYKDDPENERKMRVDYDDKIWQGRNYDLFGILADVRNGRGFAGVYTGQPFTPISQPKGLPDDVTPEVNAESDRWNGDHSHSWFTLKELLDYDWDQHRIGSGVISAHAYMKWDKKTPPDSYCGDVSGQNIVVVDQHDFEIMIRNKEIDPNTFYPGSTELFYLPEEEQKKLKELKTQRSNPTEYYVRIEWIESYRSCVGPYWWETTIPKLQELSGGNPEDVRIVFWFDN